MRAILTICLLFVLTGLAAQSELLLDANAAYREGKLAEARGFLDRAVKEDAYAEKTETWVLRGFVYKDLYKASAGTPEGELLRDEALASLYTGRGMDKQGQYRKNVDQAYDYLVKTIYNDAARALGEQDHERGILYYAKYKEVSQRYDPAMSFRNRDIEFDNALGTVYNKHYTENRNDTTWFNKAAAVYRRVLAVDPENYGANYNLATLYFNRGVLNIREMEVENDIPSLKQIQEVSKSIFLEALPYMKKAHDLNPKRKETILGLEAIHYSLQDVEQSERYRHLYEELEQDPIFAPENDH